MIESKYDWQIEQAQPDAITSLAKQAGVDGFIAQLLLQRGIDTPEKANTFLKPSIEAFHDPFLMHDMKKGIARIQQAVEAGEQITVYGDYDADGITSTTIMYEVLTDLGANVNYYIPNRFSEGYGPNAAAYQKIIQGGTTLIVTVDNGVAGHDAIAVANELKCDVIVSDHHSLPEVLPDAYAVIHPRLKSATGASYPFGDLCGAGVAFKIATALLDEVPTDLLDLAAIGTVADIVSLRDENRAIVKFGIQAIQNSQRPGLLALIKEAGGQLDQFDEQDIGFAVAPRLNSLGRMKDATVGVELLSTFDEEQAIELAKFANQQNDLRKSLVDQFYKEAVEQVETGSDLNRSTLLVVGDNWHQGVLGIVASRLVEKYQRPTLVLTSQDGTDDVKGSGRSIDQFDLFKAIDPIRDQLVAFGGHHSAVGLTVKKPNVSLLSDQLEKAAEQQQLDLSAKPKIEVAAKVGIDQLNSDLVGQLKTLAPFGQDNPKPIFDVSYDQVQSVKTMGKGADHLKFTLAKGNTSLVAVAFGKGALAAQIHPGATDLEVIGEIGENTWNNRTTLQLMVDDLKQPAAPVVDRRTRVLHEQMFRQAGTYVFFHERNLTQLKPYFADNCRAVMYDQLTRQTFQDQNLFVVDCPDVVADLADVLHRTHPKTTTLYLYKKQLVSKMGMPDRHSYAKLFRFVKENPNINIATQLKRLSKHLHIAERTIIFMIQVFLELDFITINDRVVNLNPHYQAHDLKSAPSFHLRQEQMKAEQQLLASSTRELIDFVKDCLDS
ncbi:single-stranded-DNA-specific exonuclease RecJ [Lentilactobacillus fungorum]|uniref:Single-stranded-DNA-specific exonuclease RecJ n=1 Tax=Lentilactobacillus fungorum TaxID=2201250 RepID=A0ABQ3W595_9LACO|nr:single-stranded-DNA-specific exonuclease RecJ [Lentilactobacillus fungorum]GHP15079.1 single-stranded-DNA-specific exonuclease RecJ [Lentilactobacillus fungorum]